MENWGIIDSDTVENMIFRFGKYKVIQHCLLLFHADGTELFSVTDKTTFDDMNLSCVTVSYPLRHGDHKNRE